MIDDHENEVKLRLKKIEGQVKGIQKMIDDGRSCEEIITQLMAVRAAVDKVAFQLVTTHVSECIDQLPTEAARARIERTVGLLGKIS